MISKKVGNEVDAVLKARREVGRYCDNAIEYIGLFHWLRKGQVFRTPSQTYTVSGNGWAKDGQGKSRRFVADAGVLIQR